MMNIEMGLGGLIWMLLFWGGLIILAFWLVNLLFPATPLHPDNRNKNAGETRVSSHDKTTH